MAKITEQSADLYSLLTEITDNYVPFKELKRGGLYALGVSTYGRQIRDFWDFDGNPSYRRFKLGWFIEDAESYGYYHYSLLIKPQLETVRQFRPLDPDSEDEGIEDQVLRIISEIPIVRRILHIRTKEGAFLGLFGGTEKLICETTFYTEGRIDRHASPVLQSVPADALVHPVYKAEFERLSSLL